jgi:tRNA A-37 threonylcarbamoyl transferase component Bud32
MTSNESEIADLISEARGLQKIESLTADAEQFVSWYVRAQKAVARIDKDYLVPIRAAFRMGSYVGEADDIEGLTRRAKQGQARDGLTKALGVLDALRSEVARQGGSSEKAQPGSVAPLAGDPDDSSAALSTHIERFGELKPLGAGVYGHVWRGHDSKLSRDVAIKFIRPSGRPSQDALAHARALTRVPHPNIVTVYDVTELNDPEISTVVPAIVMELVEGVTLTEKLGHLLSVEEADRIGSALIAAVSQYHEHHLAHIDLHEGNVLVGEQVKVIDPLYFDMYLGQTTASTKAIQNRDLRALRDILVQTVAATDVPIERVADFERISRPPTLANLSTALTEVLSGDDSVSPAKERLSDMEATARLRGLEGVVSGIIEHPKARYFDPARVTGVFVRFRALREELIQRNVFSDMPDRPVPESSGTSDHEGRGYILRKYLEDLLGDIHYCLKVLESLEP